MDLLGGYGSSTSSTTGGSEGKDEKAAAPPKETETPAKPSSQQAADNDRTPKRANLVTKAETAAAFPSSPKSSSPMEVVPEAAENRTTSSSKEPEDDDDLDAFFEEVEEAEEKAKEEPLEDFSKQAAPAPLEPKPPKEMETERTPASKDGDSKEEEPKSTDSEPKEDELDSSLQRATSGPGVEHADAPKDESSDEKEQVERNDEQEKPAASASSATASSSKAATSASSTTAATSSAAHHSMDAYTVAAGTHASGVKSSSSTAQDATSSSGRRKRKTHHYSQTVFGMPLTVTAAGGFPRPGSSLGPFYCLGQLGKGTFSSIHHCINLSAFHHSTGGTQQQQQQPTGASRKPHAGPSLGRQRTAAAKIELSEFKTSGVLEAEATILDFLHQSCPPGTVPVYMGHYKADKAAAIVMEFLQGQDMHQLREQVMMKQDSSSSSHHRRIHVEDAVYLTAEVMLPLLREIHDVGVVHRDVKPSNCVRQSSSSTIDVDGDEVKKENKSFCMVDFGLSKSIVVPIDSSTGDPKLPWPEGSLWLRPRNYTGPGCLRKERAEAEFRGTSMYASLRVHQLKDYARRDDMWSLLYVFCDLVAGGLPWMSYAANRDREKCKKLKERIHGDGTSGSDHTEEMLYGSHYHVTAFRREQQKAAAAAKEGGEPPVLTPLPEPLDMSKNPKLVEALRKAFEHVASLQYGDRPDYDLLQQCIREFLNVEYTDRQARRIQWEDPAQAFPSPVQKKRPSFVFSKSSRSSGKAAPTWEVMSDPDPLDTSKFQDAEQELLGSDMEVEDETFVDRLPVAARFHISQLDYNMSRPDLVPSHLALRDWCNVTLPLIYEDWDARAFEDGGHRTSTDAFRRENYLSLLHKCQNYAKRFKYFHGMDFYYVPEDENGAPNSNSGQAEEAKKGSSEAKVQGSRKKRRIESGLLRYSHGSPMVAVSQTLMELGLKIKKEESKKAAPPAPMAWGAS